MVRKVTGNMAYGSQTLHRAYSVSSVEGVELRLNDKFKPTNKVALPLQYKHKDPQSLNSAVEYEFKAENNFLQWLAGVRRAEAEKEEQRKHQQLGAEAAEAALQREETAPEGDPQTSDEFLMQSNALPPPVLTPVAARLGQEMLQPVPLTNSDVKPVSNDTNVGTDNWDDFEGRAMDPFELTELETINDMEELRSVLANSIPPQPLAVASDQLQQSSPPPTDLSETGPEEATLQSDSGNVTVTDDSHQVSLETSLSQVSFRPSGVHQADVSTHAPDLPLRNKPKQPPIAVLPNRTISSTPSSGLPPLRSDPFASRNPLPSIGPPRENSDTSLLSGVSIGSSHVASDQRGPSPPPYTALDTSPLPSMVGSSIPLDPPPNYPMDELDANFSPVNLSRYSPLPPPPPSNQFRPSINTSTISVVEQDPTYEALSVEEKNFVNTIAGMGFPKGRTARAVKNVGSDDRQVVDLLCAVDVLCGQGFPEAKVEVALSLQDNNQEKAQAFLSLWQRFEELGFKSEDIKRELIIHGNDEEKVLDTLTR